MRHKLMRLWTQIRWISRQGYYPLNWTNDPELKRLARASGTKVEVEFPT